MNGEPGTLSKGRGRSWRPWIIVILALAVGFFVRTRIWGFASHDFFYFLQPWYDFLKENGHFSALRYEFANYTPPYLYFLTFATYLPIDKLLAIKSISIVFDVVLAFLAGAIIRRRYPNGMAWAFGFAAVFFLPTVMLNSSVLGQSDAFYMAALLAMLLFLLRRRPWLACFFFGVAFSVKAQALFLAPLLLLLLVRKKLSWISIVMIPAAPILLNIPAFLAGRPVLELVGIYWRQFRSLPLLSINAPNLWQWIRLFPSDYNPTIYWGMAIATVVIAAVIILLWRRRTALTGEGIVRIALLFALLAPFLLPKMHDRFFFPADILSVLYAWYRPDRWFLPAGIVFTSMMSYLPYIADLPNIDFLFALPVLLILALMVVFFDCWRSVEQPRPAG